MPVTYTDVSGAGEQTHRNSSTPEYPGLPPEQQRTENIHGNTGDSTTGMSLKCDEVMPLGFCYKCGKDLNNTYCNICKSHVILLE